MNKSFILYLVLYPLMFTVFIILFPNPVLYTYYLYVLAVLAVLGVVATYLSSIAFNKIVNLKGRALVDHLEKMEAFKKTLDERIEDKDGHAYGDVNKIMYRSLATVIIDLSIYYYLAIFFPAIAPIYIFIFIFRLIFYAMMPNYLVNMDIVYKNYKTAKGV